MRLFYFFKIGFSDISKASRFNLNLVGLLGWQDIIQRYRRSYLGPFWISASLAVMIGSLAIVFGKLFKSPLEEYLPFLTVGIIFWTYISTVIVEGCTSFISNSAIIKQMDLPFFVYILRMIWRNLIILAHNLVVLPLVFLMLGKQFNLIAFLAIPGLLLVSLNLAWITLLLATISSRYRDMSQLVVNIMQVIFYFTPIMWMPQALPQGTNLHLLDFNLIYHFIEVVRTPLLGGYPNFLSWIVMSFFLIFGWLISLVFFGIYKKRIAYWM